MFKNKTKSIVRAYTYKEFVQLFNYCTEEHQKELLDKLKTAKKPAVFGGVQVPEDLNHVSYGLLDDLSNISRNKDCDPMARAISVILGIKEDLVYQENVFDVFGMSRWIESEIKRINDLFAKISPKYSPEEIAAGVKSLDFGSFGVLDWYSHRQGISDQNEVNKVAWVRIYTCMRQDNQKAEYEKRLNYQYQLKFQIRNGRH